MPKPLAGPEIDERARKELRLLGRLEKLKLPFRVPKAVGVYPDSGRLALVRQFLLGIELDLRSGRQGSVRPWEIVGEIAAAIHSLPGALFERILPGHATRRGHAEESLRGFDGLEAPEAVDARAWVEAHLPPAEPSLLVHGDLLGQNILLGLDDPPGVIDWEYAIRGDPAYEMAIVTRGVKQPFQLEHVLEKLIDSYRRHGGHESVTREQVRVHELCLVAGWVRDALAGAGPHRPADELARLRGLLARAERGA